MIILILGYDGPQMGQSKLDRKKCSFAWTHNLQILAVVVVGPPIFSPTVYIKKFMNIIYMYIYYKYYIYIYIIHIIYY